MNNPRCFAGFIITYRRPQILEVTINAVLSQTRRPECLLIVDNDEEQSAKPVAEAFQHQGVCYHAVGHNSGPAGGAARGLKLLAEQGYQWIWWGDDDDPPRWNTTFDTLLRTIPPESVGGATNSVGVIASNGGRWDWRRGRHTRVQDEELEKEIVEIDLFSGGGNPIISKEVVDHVGLPNEALFFGFEEPEYALRIRRAGFKIITNGRHFFERRASSDRLGIVESPGRVYVEPDAMWREYYSYRNKIFTMNRVLERQDLAARDALKAVAKAALSFSRGWAYGCQYAGLLLRAVKDAYLENMGPTVGPVAKYDG